jgi:hypothetical protein
VAYTTLASESLKPSEVLWVRFTEEDRDFDYECLRAFTYHNCRNHDAHKISDKYVKGQEFPIVVIEGFPSFMDRFGGENAQENEEKLWAFRREVYLCASRATCFLYFVCNPQSDTEENIRIRNELQEVVQGVAMPSNLSSGGTKSWKIFVPATKERRNLDVFEDTRVTQEAVDGEGFIVKPGKGVFDQYGKSQPDQQPTQIRTLQLGSPITVKDLAPMLGIKAFMIIRQLLDIQIYANINQTLELDLVARLCEVNGFRFERLEASMDGVSKREDITKTNLGDVDPISKEKIKMPPTEASHHSKQPQVTSAFHHSITIDGHISVIDLARLLGVQHREIINHAARLGFYARGSTVLETKTIEAIAAKHGFSVELVP